MRARVVLPLVLPAVLIGCETETNILTELPEGELPETFVAVDRTTLEPSGDQTLTAGNTVPVNVNMDYRAAEPELEFWLDVWFGIPVATDVTLYDGSEYRQRLTGVFRLISVPAELEGELSGEGEVYVPEVSPDCRSYDRVGILGYVMTQRLFEDLENFEGDEFSRAAGEKAAIAPEVDLVAVPVTGSRAPTPCLRYRNQSSLAWGAGVWYRIRGGPEVSPPILPGSASPFQLTVDGEPAKIMVQTWGFREDDTERWLDYRIWMPAGLPEGDHVLRIFSDAGEIAYGNDRPIEIPVFSAPDDVFDAGDRNNDSFEAAVEDDEDWGYLGPQIPLLNPGLSLPADDQIVDASANPLGSSDWGVGDWFLLPVESEMDMCAKVEPSVGDDVDLMLFDADGTLLASSTTDGDAAESVRVDGVASGSELRMWVAPAAITTEFGIYAVKAWDCAVSEPVLD